MRRLAPILAALLASGCIVGDDHHDVVPSGSGSAIVYWDFIRNAPAQPGGAVTYDASLAGTGTGPCAQSGVEIVSVDVSGVAQQFVVDCVYQGVQGATLDFLPVGPQAFRLRGWRGDYAVYDTTVTLTVYDGQETNEGVVHVDAVSAPMDLFAYLVAGQTQLDCASAGVPNVSYEVFDSYGTKTDSGLVGCSEPQPMTVFVGDLDLDNYTVRMRGTPTTGPSSGQPVFDSCGVPFDHFGAQIGADGFAPQLIRNGTCP